MSAKQIDSFTIQDIQDQYHTYDLLQAGNSWSVMCFSGEDPEDLEFQWEVRGYWKGGVEDGIGRNVGGTWLPFNEELARKEFERWRK
jgi:hypothetical protein